MRNICLIPARSGSKGLKDKNMAFLNNKPILQFTIEAALESGVFSPEDIYLSTDSEQYINDLGDLGISVKLRDNKLASDNSTTSDVILDFLSEFEDQDINFVLLQPTSPLRSGQHIREAYDLYIENNRTNQVVSISEVDKSPNLFTKLGSNGELEDIIGIDKGYRRQNHEKLYAPNGALYITEMNEYLNTQSFFTDKTIGYIMDKKSSIDIDDYDDFVKAIGAIFFDYSRREKENAPLYLERFVTMYKPDVKNIIIGDSRTEKISISGYDNLSMGGVTAKTMLTIVNNEVQADLIKNVVINLGVNDIIVGYSLSEIKETIKELIEKFSKSNIVICNVFPTIYRPNVDNDMIRELNDYINQLDNVTVVDTYNLFVKNGKLNFDSTMDGLHLRESATKRLEEHIANQVK